MKAFFSALFRRQSLLIFGLVPAVAVLQLLAGCSHKRQFLDRYDPVFSRVYTPQVPEFLSGPAGALLTNTAGFSAKARYESRSGSASEAPEVIEGELLARGTKLLFAPHRAENAPKEVEAAGFMFMWDVATGSGYVASEALQGFAPVGANVKPSSVSLQPGSQADGQTAVVGLSDGRAELFKVSGWDDHAVPTRVSSVTNAPAFTLKLSKARAEVPAAGLFAPPEGFSKYASAELLADELAARRNGIRRGAWFQTDRMLKNITPPR